MKKIVLTKDKFALIDDEDFDLINKYKWRFSAGGYACSDIEGKTVYMHRFIMDKYCSKENNIDHINRNKLDNQKSNIRFCSQSENIQNASLRKDNKTGFKGVTVLENRNKKYISSIGYKNKMIYLGSFYNLNDAMYAYNKAASELYGEFAFVNS